MFWTGPVRNPKRVVAAVSAGLPAVAGAAKREPIDTLRRRPRCFFRRQVGEAHERRPGGISVKALARGPWKGRSPREHPAIRRAKHTRGPCGTLGRAKAQEPRLAGTGRRFGDGGTGKGNGRWVLPGGNVRIPSERRRLRRANPMSAAGAKQTRHGLGGSKPSRG
jgi:hypothetical protein